MRQPDVGGRQNGERENFPSTGYNWDIITALLFPPPCFPSCTTICPECLSFSVVAHPNPINVWLKGHLLQQASLFSLAWQELSLV